MTEKVDMFEFVTESYRKYGDEVNKNRMITLSIDGLKPIERRVLVSAFMIAKNKKVKSVQVDGYCLGHFHPHSMCYGTIVQMVKQGFLEGQGQFGANIGTEPTSAAASRYTECGMSEFTKSLAFELIDYVPWVESEISAEIKEPLYLPTKYPFCLIGNVPTSGIGFGYAANVPCYKIEDLKKRLMWLLKERKREPVIAPITDCDIVSDKESLKKLLTEGKETLIYKGKITIDKIKKHIICHSIPPRVTFSGLYAKLQKKYKDLAILDSSCDETGTCVIFYIDRVRNQQEIFEELIKDFKESIVKNANFENNQIIYNDSDDLHNMMLMCMPVDTMLLDTFNNYMRLYGIMLDKQILIKKNKIASLKILSLIKKILPKYLNEIKKKPETVIVEISKKININLDIVKKIFNTYTIIKLLNVSIDTDKLMGEVKDIEDIKNNLFKHIIKEYENN